jgi:hypothetical protein
MTHAQGGTRIHFKFLKDKTYTIVTAGSQSATGHYVFSINRRYTYTSANLENEDIIGDSNGRVLAGPLTAYMLL